MTSLLPTPKPDGPDEASAKPPVRIVEVGPRDGLQNETLTLGVDDRARLVQRLADGGLRAIETGSFVSAKRVPQMADSACLLEQIPRRADVCYSALVPNVKGMETAVSSGVDEVAVFSSASEAFCQHNIHCGIEESFDRFYPIFEMAKSRNMRVRAYVSCAFGCPYEGAVAIDAVVSVARRFMDMGSYEVAISDTTGVGTITATREVIKAVAHEIGYAPIAAHFHDTRGQALANIVTCLEMGITTFDSSIAGLGGCPYAPGASGNVATEDLVFMLEGMGYSTGTDLDALVATGLWISEKLGRQSTSKVSQAMAAQG